jgi:hypothetical protein
MNEQSRHSLSAAAIAALRQGNKIEAIKLVRREKGLELKEAKDLVEAYVRTDPDLSASLAAKQSGMARSAFWWLTAIAAIVVAAYVMIARPLG